MIRIVEGGERRKENGKAGKLLKEKMNSIYSGMATRLTVQQYRCAQCECANRHTASGFHCRKGEPINGIIYIG